MGTYMVMERRSYTLVPIRQLYPGSSHANVCQIHYGFESAFASHAAESEDGEIVNRSDIPFGFGWSITIVKSDRGDTNAHHINRRECTKIATYHIVI
jgi:hypothetical protein